MIRMLGAQGRQVLEPIEHDGAIVYHHLTGIGDLPAVRADR